VEIASQSSDGRPDLGPDRRLVIAALGIVQILGWGTSLYVPAVFGGPIVAETGWSLGYVVSGTSIGLLTGGLISPLVGHWIDRHGGRPVLLASSLLFAAGLIGMGLAPNLPAYLAAWIVLGLAMGTGLYDAAFAALGRMYGHSARTAITNLTLIGGFASTVCWPLSAFLIDTVGWRNACFVYAALHLVIALPLQMAVVRGQRAIDDDEEGGASAASKAQPLARETIVLVLLGIILSIMSAIGSIMLVHLMIFLQARGATFAAAVTLGTLFGPSQVVARVVERVFGGNYHPVWTMIFACVTVAVSLILLTTGFPFLAVTIILFGAGFGVGWLARGTLPLALFGPVRFPRLMGRLAFPALITQALAPSAGALLIERAGVDWTIGVLTFFALINVVLIATFWMVCRGRLVSST
jgi:predicted MFS family arabinose efflux permease